MSEKQIMLDGSIVPVAGHRDDIVVCSDGSECRREDALVDCRGGFHCDEDSLDDANNDIVRELLDAHSEWIDDYVSGDDYGDGYAYLISEGCHGWDDRIGEWLDDNHTVGEGWGARPVYTGKMRDALVAAIAQAVKDYDDFEMKYHSNEYACWSGDGVALDSFEVGEYEDQMEVSMFPEFEVLHEQGRLEGCLASYNGDLYIRCNDYYDRDAGRRVRTTYVERGFFYAYSCGHGRWHGVVSEESLNRYLCEAIVEYCERADRND